MEKPKLRLMTLLLGLQASHFVAAEHEVTHIDHKTLRQNPYQPTYEQGTLRRSGAALIIEDRPHVLWVRHRDHGGLSDDTTRELGQLLGFADAYPPRPESKPVVLRPAAPESPAAPPPSHQDEPVQLKSMPEGVLRDGYYGKEYTAPPDAALSITELETAGEPSSVGPTSVQPFLTIEQVADRAQAGSNQGSALPIRAVHSPASVKEDSNVSVMQSPVQGEASKPELGIDLSKWQDHPAQNAVSGSNNARAPSVEEISTLVRLQCEDDRAEHRDAICYP